MYNAVLVCDTLSKFLSHNHNLMDSNGNKKDRGIVDLAVGRVPKSVDERNCHTHTHPVRGSCIAPNMVLHERKRSSTEREAAQDCIYHWHNTTRVS
mmetsp:Transcript_17316/g.36175  ORF Transcript_17316/g.36175 Transcript_17316/m.36175 type:complete len:96 (-) Transcript_17316:751-1038(-)